MARVLIWQWGRRGAMPRFAREFARGCAADPNITPLLCLARDAEIAPADTAFRLATYCGWPGCVLRLALWPMLMVELLLAFHRLKPDLAIGIHAGPLDPLTALALRLSRVRFWLIVHDATRHPGDRRLVMLAQAATLRWAEGAIVLSSHVETTLRARGFSGPILRISHPPFACATPPDPPRAHGGALRLLCFGRLLAYKGLDLLADAVEHLGARDDLALRVVGEGPHSLALSRLRACAWVRVENRWVPDAELGALFAWADVVVLPYTEASQSGVAAAAMGAGRLILATAVGGLAEQCAGYRLAHICAPQAVDLAQAIETLAAVSDSVEAGVELFGNCWAETALPLIRALQIRPLAKC